MGRCCLSVCLSVCWTAELITLARGHRVTEQRVTAIPPPTPQPRCPSGLISPTAHSFPQSPAHAVPLQSTSSFSPFSFFVIQHAIEAVMKVGRAVLTARSVINQMEDYRSQRHASRA